MRGLRRLIRRAKEFAFPLYCGVDAVRFEDLIPGEKFDVRFENIDVDPGSGSMWDLTTLATLVAITKPTTCFEFGTGHGRTTLHMALNAPNDAKIYTLDISDAPPVGTAFRGHPLSDRITQLTDDSQTFDYGPWLGQADFVFVDGAHDFDSARHDTAVAFRLVSDRGIIVWDDFTPAWPGVVKALRRCSQGAAIRRIPGTKLAIAAQPRTR